MVQPTQIGQIPNLVATLNIKPLTQIGSFAQFTHESLTLFYSDLICQRFLQPIGQKLTSTNRNGPVYGLEKGMVTEKIQIQTKRMRRIDLVGCAIECAKIIIQALQFQLIQTDQSFKIALTGKKPKMSPHQKSEKSGTNQQADGHPQPTGFTQSPNQAKRPRNQH